MITTHIMQSVRIDQEYLYLEVDGKNYAFALSKISTRLKEAEDFQRQLFKISPSGYGIHWPLIDEDLSVDALIKST